MIHNHTHNPAEKHPGFLSAIREATEFMSRVFFLPAKNFVVPVALAAGILTGCTSRFEIYNTNPNQVTKDQMDAYNYLVGAKIVSLQGLVIPIQEHQYQYQESLSGSPYGGYIASYQKWAQRWETYNPDNQWRATPFKDVITNLYAPYRGVLNDAPDDPVAVAFADLFRVAVMHRLTDNYGPIPYSNVLETEEAVVTYDSQQEVYTQMFAELDGVIEAFTANRDIPAAQWSAYDRVYYGDINKWIKYANSLRLRMATRLRYVDEALYKEQAAKAIAGGLILTNEDNACYHTTDNRVAVINSWGDHRVAADIICYMNGYNDPRREKMFEKNLMPLVVSDTSPVGPEEDRKYVGARVGFNSSEASDFQYNYSNWKVVSSDPILWMNAAEVNFLLAEYELMANHDAAAAKNYYETGIRLSFEERGASGAEDYIKDSESIPEIYADPLGEYTMTKVMSECTIAWDDAADDESRLEKIITQKWIANFPLGNEAWAEYRRTGYPKLMPAPHNLGPYNIDLNHHARRLPYPVEEYEQNNANVNAAIAMIGQENSLNGSSGDSMASRVWWDVKPYSEIK